MRGMWDVSLGSATTTADLLLQDIGTQPSWGVSTGPLTTRNPQWSQGPGEQPEKHSPLCRRAQGRPRAQRSFHTLQL